MTVPDHRPESTDKPEPTDKPESTDKISDFQRAGQEPSLPLWKEFCLFIVQNKAWWMVPILLTLAAVGVLVAMSSTGAAPFIYTLF